MSSGESNGDCPVCYGDAAQCGRLPDCQACKYADSCRYYADNPAPDGKQRDTRGHHVSLDRYGFAREVAAKDEPYYDERPGGKGDDYQQPVYSNADLQHLLEFMLRGVDDYSLAIVECVLREEHATASQVAKAFGVSREAMHRKLIDSCKQYPYLRDTLRCALYRCNLLANPENRSGIAGRRKREVDAGGKGETKEQMECLF